MQEPRLRSLEQNCRICDGARAGEQRRRRVRAEERSDVLVLSDGLQQLAPARPVITGFAQHIKLDTFDGYPELMDFALMLIENIEL